MKTLLTLFLSMILTFSISDSYGQKRSKSSSSSSSKTQTVKGYSKKDGTKVKAYERSPKGSKKKTSSIRIDDKNIYIFIPKRKDQIEAK